MHLQHDPTVVLEVEARHDAHAGACERDRPGRPDLTSEVGEQLVGDASGVVGAEQRRPQR
ncbi:MAG: hypothetical protein AAGA17_02625 [Actinomycetota bacterium]